MPAPSRRQLPGRAKAASQARRRPVLETLFDPIDPASLALFRIVFGALMVFEVWRYVEKGWIKIYFIDPTFFFRFYGFGWLPAPSPRVAYGLWGLMGLAALGVCLGAFYRISAAVMTATVAYFFLLDAANYLNHFYLICLLGALLTTLPAHRIWSLHAWRRPPADPTVPAWTIWLLRLQIAIPYFYAGIAKIDRDWLLSIPMQQMLFANVETPVIGRYLVEWWVADLFAFGGLLFDLTVVFGLLWKRTRAWGFAACVIFHLTNKLLLNIGIFPWMMIAATTLFFEPDWPRRLFRSTPLQIPDPTTLAPFAWTHRKRSLLLALAVWMGLQFTIPLRHHFYAGNTNWTEEGHRFAWRMKLRAKDALLTFYVVDPRTGDVAPLDPSPYVTERQISEMSQHPDMILQFARFLAQQLDEVGFGDQEVRAEAWCSLNGRDPQLLIDPEADLSDRLRGGDASEWIMPLEDPPGRRQLRAIESVRALRAKVYSESRSEP